MAAGDVIPFGVAAVVGAALAAVVELVPLRIDDNITVPIVSGVAMTLVGV